jgi:serine/threonine-protein kinase
LVGNTEPGGPPAAPEAGKPPARAQLGDTWTSKADGATLVYVPAGKFYRGALEFDEQSNPDEFPLREIELDAFWIDQTEVTNAMFAAFLTAQGVESAGGVPWYEVGSPDALISVQGPKWVSERGYEDHPAVEVTWEAANAYCAWVDRRLPTEAEWEKAARGPKGQIYPWGDEAPNCGLVNFWDGNKVCADGTASVGSFPAGASPYGALDMSGNVWEWTADWYDEFYYEAAPSENPTGPASGNSKVFRGGAWESGPRNLRASDRNNDQTNAARYRLGFRCALTP